MLVKMSSTVQISQIKNLSNNSIVLSFKNGQFVEISNYSAKTIVLDLKDVQLTPGELVLIVGEVIINTETLHFEAVAKVLTNIPLVEGYVRIEFLLNQIQKDLWKRFLDSKDLAQNRVDNLFKKIKGE